MNLKLWHLGLFAATIILIVLLLLPNAKEKGVLLARSGKVEKAEEKLLPIINDDPGNLQVVEELAKGYDMAGKPDKSVSLYENYLKKDPYNQQIISKLAESYIADFKFKKAFELLERDKQKNYKELITLAVKMGDLDKAVEYSKEEFAVINDKEERMKLLKDIEKYQQWQLNYKGVGQAREEIAKENDNLENNLEALDFFVWKKNKKKMKYYARKVEAFKDLPLDAERKLRSIWITLRDGKRAVAAAAKVVAFPEADYQDWSDYLTLLSWTGNTRKALVVVEKLIKKYPREQELYLQGLALAEKLGEKKKRAELLVQYYDYNHDLGLLLEAGDIYLSLGDEKKAVGLFKTVLDSKDKGKFQDLTIEEKLKLAELFIKTENKEGKVLLSQVLKRLLGKDLRDLTSNDFWVALDYARKVKNKKLAARLYENFYRLNGDLQMLRDARDLYVEVDDIKRAVEINEKLLAKYELSDSEGFGLLGQYEKLGEKQKAAKLAQKLYAKILSGEIKEDDPYWLALDYATATKNKLMKARILDKFYQLNKDPGLLREAAGIYTAAGQDKKALQDYEVLLASDFAESYDKEELLRLYGKIGDDKKVKELAYRFYLEAMAVKALDKVGDLYYTLVSVLPEVGYQSASVKLIKKYAEAGDIEAKIQLAEYYQDSQKIAEAKKELIEIVSNKSIAEDLRSQALVQLAYLYTEEFYTDKADQLAVAEQGRRYILKAVQVLEESLKNATAANMDNIKASIDNFRLVLLRENLLKKNFMAADVILKSLYNPDSGVYLGIASAYFDSGQEKKAKKYLVEVVDTSKFGVNEFSLLGYLYASFKEFDKSLVAYKKAESISQGLDKDVMLGLAQVYGQTGKVDQQYKIVDFYTTFGKTEVSDWLAAANARAEHNDNKGEFIILTDGVQVHRKSAVLLSRLISKLVGYGERKKALVLAKTLRGLKVRKNVDELFTVGYALLDVGQVREAGRMFLAARDIDAQAPQAYLALARYYTAVYLYPQAQKAYMAYLKKNKNDAAVWYELAVLKRAAGFRGGRYAFLKANSILAQKKETAADFSLASSIAFYLNKRDDALRYGRYATVLDPNSAEYKLDLAELYNSFGQPEFALENTAQVKNDDNLVARREGLKAGAYILSRKFKKGIDSLKKVIARRPDDSAAVEAMGYSELELGEWVEAADSLKVAEIKSNNEEERLMVNYQHRGDAKVFDRIDLPDLEE